MNEKLQVAFVQILEDGTYKFLSIINTSHVPREGDLVTLDEETLCVCFCNWKVAAGQLYLVEVFLEEGELDE